MAELISNPIRIPCGGFDIDNDTLYFQNDVLKSKREEPELPAVSSIDNGKVLTVAEGSWTAANPATELPSVSTTDNGDVLTVVEGTWAKAVPTGGGALIVHMSSEEIGSDTRYTLDKTAREIIAAMPLVYVEETVEIPDVGAIHSYNIIGYLGGNTSASDYGETSGGYVFSFYVSDLNRYNLFTAETLNDYPLYLDAK